CITSKSDNRHTARHHQHETSALGSARQNRYTNLLHTASADRSRTYVTHLIEAGWDPLFVQQQAGHEHASTTAIYTCVSSDFRTRTLRRALDATAAAVTRPGKKA
ncbi:MAG: tyrosine-type recombinase/integrase, partial [Streptosporangiaceae bacterium]